MQVKKKNLAMNELRKMVLIHSTSICSNIFFFRKNHENFLVLRLKIHSPHGFGI